MKHTITLWLLIAALLLVLPTVFADLEIDDSSILVNGQSYTIGQNVNVSPGDIVTLRYSFRNTFTDRTLGHVTVSASTSATGLTGIPFTGGMWALTAGQSRTEQFTFTIPLASTLNTFEVILDLAYDNIPDVLVDQAIISFNVVRENIAVDIVGGSAEVTGITCTSGSANLGFRVINIGSTPFTTNFAPEVLVYDQAGSGSAFNAQTGEFTFSTAPLVRFRQSLSPLNPGEQRTESINVDISRLRAGSHRLYIYLVNPYFSQAAFFIGDQDSAAFTTTSCASSFSPSSTSVSVLENENAAFSVTLADASLESAVAWVVTRAGTEVDRETGTDTYTFSQATAGTYSVQVTIGQESLTWTATVSVPAPAALSISAITIENVRAGQSANATITVTNTGANMNIGSLTAVLEGVNARYQARIVGTLPATLAAGASTTALRLELTVPTDEASGAHNIGNLVVSGRDAAGTAVSATQAISLNPQSFLTIESVKVNGKAAGDLTLEEANEFDVKVKNTYTQDINDITVTVTILDVDGEDIEEESASFDLGDGKDDTITLSFDLSGENVDESQYTVRIEVEGEADDRTQHRTVQTVPVDVERENHKVIVQKATLGSSTLQCTRQTSLQVIVENIGESNEDDVEIKVKNIPLGIELSKSDIELDKFSGSDNEYRTTFSLNFEDAVSGSHILTVEVYRDGSVDDTQEVPVQISTCSTTSTTTGQTQVQADADSQLAAELQRQLQARQQDEVTGQQVQSSFRQSDRYVLLLGALAVLMFLAVVMAIAVLVVKKR